MGRENETVEKFAQQYRGYGEKHKSNYRSNRIDIPHLALMEMFTQGRIEELVERARTRLAKAGSYPPPPPSDDNTASAMQIKRATDILRAGFPGKALGALSASAMINPTQELKEEVQDLNPLADPVNIADLGDIPPAAGILEAKDMRWAASHFNNQSGCDLAGYSPNLFKIIFPAPETPYFQDGADNDAEIMAQGGNNPSYVAQAHLDLVNRFFGLSGSKPLTSHVVATLRKLRSMVLPKPDGKIRP